MKKLSELPNGLMLVISIKGRDSQVMTKKDLLEDLDFWETRNEVKPKVFIGDKVVAGFSFESAIESAADEMYEDWQQDVWYELAKLDIDFEAIEEAIQKVFSDHSTYYEGEEVDIEN